MRPEEYQCAEWTELLQVLDKKQLRNTLRKAYRKVARPLVAKARTSLMQRGPQNIKGNKADWKSAVRARVYSRGGGFMVTVQPHGKRGYHVNRQGKEKPVLMWAEEGTAERFTRVKGFFSKKGAIPRGKMPKYGFLAAVEAPIYIQAEALLQPELESAVFFNCRKYGWI